MLTGVNNIRIATRIANLLEMVFRNNRQLDSQLVDVALNATVVLTALYYRGFDKAPEFDAVLRA
ncbi:hypothetical protein SB847_22155, partial [Bacillus sp. SIMBA_026]|uniref:hypothetical protein n=1 Tax=Bacillus sp. SIMBA_026 TaxID=3085769 RepID=UPI00397843AA